jgi:hypothetical protein
VGVSSDHSPLALMMELEGISLASLSHWIHKRRQRSDSGALPENAMPNQP